MIVYFLVPKEIIGENLHVNDRYILLGEWYTRIRKSMSQCFDSRSSQPLQEELTRAIQASYGAESFVFPLAAIALYKNVTTLYKEMPNVPRDFFEPALASLFGRYRVHWEPLLDNTLAHNLAISRNTWPHIELSLLLVQLKFSILFAESRLCAPLLALINSPSVHSQAYLPCMPQDSLYDIYQAVKKGVQSVTTNILVFIFINYVNICDHLVSRVAKIRRSMSARMDIRMFCSTVVVRGRSLTARYPKLTRSIDSRIN